MLLLGTASRGLAYVGAHAPHHTVPSAGKARGSVGMQIVKGPENFEDDQMRNINRAGVSDARQNQINELMSKLRSRGSVGDSSELGNAESFLSKPPAPLPEPELEPEILEQFQVAADAAASAGFALSEDEAQTMAADAPEDEVAKTTSGIGGSWSGKKAQEAKKEKHAPKVSTWGVFERPADISKAYGGGRQVGVGGYQPTEEEIAKKRAETEAKLKKFREGQGADIELQEQHTEEIQSALKEARQLMRFGSTRGALEELEAVQKWCCAATELGSETLLELGMTRIAAGDNAGAKPVLVQLQNRAPSTQIKRAAQQMLFQEEAQSFLKVEKDNSNEEFAKIARLGLKSSLRVANDKRYDISGAYLTSANRKPVSSLPEARQILRSAAARRDDGGASLRITQALEFLPTLSIEERLPRSRTTTMQEVPEAALSAVGGGSGGGGSGGGAKEGRQAPEPSTVERLLEGEWLLGFSSNGKALSFAPAEACQELKANGAFERSLPSGPVGAIVRLEGQYRLQEAVKREPRLNFQVETATLGPLPLPILGRGTEESVILLDSLMCIMRTTSGGSGFTVWVRPSMARARALEADEQ